MPRANATPTGGVYGKRWAAPGNGDGSGENGDEQHRSKDPSGQSGSLLDLSGVNHPCATAHLLAVQSSGMCCGTVNK